MRGRRGRFIVLEGADGSGKSTQAARLVGWLAGQGIPALHVRDPGATALAESIRTILLDPANAALTVESETFLYLAARAQLAAEVIAPTLAAGRWVVCERWTLSTEVYQGIAGGFGADEVRKVARHAERGASPDRVIVLDVPVGAGLARKRGARDRVERKSGRFHAEVVRAYRRLARGRRRFVVLPHGTLDRTAARIHEEVAVLVG